MLLSVYARDPRRRTQVRRKDVPPGNGGRLPTELGVDGAVGTLIEDDSGGCGNPAPDRVTALPRNVGVSSRKLQSKSRLSEFFGVGDPHATTVSASSVSNENEPIGWTRCAGDGGTRWTDTLPGSVITCGAALSVSRHRASSTLLRMLRELLDIINLLEPSAPCRWKWVGVARAPDSTEGSVCKTSAPNGVGQGRCARVTRHGAVTGRFSGVDQSSAAAVSTNSAPNGVGRPRCPGVVAGLAIMEGASRESFSPNSCEPLCSFGSDSPCEFRVALNCCLLGAVGVALPRKDGCINSMLLFRSGLSVYFGVATEHQFPTVGPISVSSIIAGFMRRRGLPDTSSDELGNSATSSSKPKEAVAATVPCAPHGPCGPCVVCIVCGTLMGFIVPCTLHHLFGATCA